MVQELKCMWIDKYITAHKIKIANHIIKQTDVLITIILIYKTSLSRIGYLLGNTFSHN